MPLAPVVLSKSRYLAALQCPKRLWLEVRRRDLLADPTPQQQSIFDQGREVGLWARGLYPGGVEIVEGPLETASAVASTEKAVREGAQVLYEAAVEKDDTRARADLLLRNGDETWDLVEVKSSTSLSEHYHDDLAFQRFAFERAGYPIRRTVLCHLNRAYVRQGPLQLQDLFRLDDRTREVAPMVSAVPQRLAAFQEALSSPEPPAVEIGRRCDHPYECPFAAFCWKDVPKGSVFELTRGAQQAEKLYASGVRTLAEVPGDFKANRLQTLQLKAVREGSPQLNLPGIRRFLAKVAYPIQFLDFEAFAQAVPPFDETSPYQHIPFQFSLHVLEKANGGLLHREFLASGPQDPRRAFTEALLEAVSPDGTVLTYSPYENRILKDMQRLFPDLAEPLAAVEARTLDLAAPFRNGDVMHADFGGSHSIKKVLPVLAPGMGYGGMEVAQGLEAVNAFQRLRSGDLQPGEAVQIRQALLDYCAQDTLAMVKLLDYLRKAAI